jgi:hypothetical protein
VYFQFINVHFLSSVHMQWMGVGCWLRFFCYSSIRLTATVPVPTLTVNRSFTVPCILRNLKVHYTVHKTLLLVPVMSQMNTVLILPFHFFNIHWNVFFSSTPRSSKRSLFLSIITIKSNIWLSPYLLLVHACETEHANLVCDVWPITLWTFFL